MDDAEELNVLRETGGAHIPLISWRVKSALRRGAARKRSSRPWGLQHLITPSLVHGLFEG